MHLLRRPHQFKYYFNLIIEVMYFIAGSLKSTDKTEEHTGGYSEVQMEETYFLPSVFPTAQFLSQSSRFLVA